MATLTELKKQAKEQYQRGKGNQRLKGYNRMSKSQLEAILGGGDRNKKSMSTIDKRAASAGASVDASGKAKEVILEGIKKDVEAARKANPRVSQEELRKVAAKALGREVAILKGEKKREDFETKPTAKPATSKAKPNLEPKAEKTAKVDKPAKEKPPTKTSEITPESLIKSGMVSHKVIVPEDFRKEAASGRYGTSVALLIAETKDGTHGEKKDAEIEAQKMARIINHAKAPLPEVKGPKIKTPQDFDKAFDEIYSKHAEKSNDPVEIYKIRREIGNRVGSREEFDKHLARRLKSDKDFAFTGGSYTFDFNSHPDRYLDAYATPTVGQRTFVMAKKQATTPTKEKIKQAGEAAKKIKEAKAKQEIKTEEVAKSQPQGELKSGEVNSKSLKEKWGASGKELDAVARHEVAKSRYETYSKFDLEKFKSYDPNTIARFTEIDDDGNQLTRPAPIREVIRTIEQSIKQDKAILDNPPKVRKADAISPDRVLAAKGIMEGLKDSMKENLADGVFTKDGKLAAVYTYKLDKKKGSLYVDYLASSPDNFLSGKSAIKGGGTQAIKQAVQKSIDSGFNGRVELDALPDAAPFYEKLGFKKIPGTSHKMALDPNAAKRLLNG